MKAKYITPVIKTINIQTQAMLDGSLPSGGTDGNGGYNINASKGSAWDDEF